MVFSVKHTICEGPKLHQIWYLVVCGIECHSGSFLDDTSYELSEQILSWVMDEFHPLAKTLPSLVNNFVMKYWRG